MSETKFTPGPWLAHDDHPQHACYRIAPVDYQIVEVATVYSPGDPEADANASLIAAAPELYEALEGVIERYAPAYHDCVDDGMPECELCTARAALAKARGES